MRAFLGIALPDAVRSSLAGLQRQLGASGADVKWVERDHLHVTLRFLGEISEIQGGQIEELLVEIAKRHEAFELGLDGVGAFPSVGSPRVVWVGLRQGNEQVVKIAEELEAGLRRLDCEPEERPFHPHVTLGRVRSPRRRDALAQRFQTLAWEPPEPFQVTALTLYRSDLHPSGPRYTVLATVPLGTPAASP